MARQLTFGVIVGNRGFFPDHLAKTGREEILRVLNAAGIKPIILTPEESKFGAVETPDEARRCADLFRKHRDDIDGIIVTLPNFGEERGIVDAIRYSTLKVPVLVQATPDRRDDMKISDRRDSFCGKMSACNNLMQYGIPYSITALAHRLARLRSVCERSAWFSAVCRVSYADSPTFESARSVHARLRSIPSATVKSCSNVPAFRSSRSIYRKCLAASIA